MKDDGMTDALLRKFLLGKVDDQERERIENLFLTDSQARERLLAAEEDLIEDYLEKNLTTSDTERFLAVFAQTAEQRRKLRIRESIKELASADAPVSQIPSNISGWSRLWSRFRLKPLMVIPIALATVAIIVAAVWQMSRTEQRNRQRFAVEQQLAQLNTPSSLSEAPAQMVLLDLSPLTLRGVEKQVELKRSPDIRVVELRLPWVEKERFSTYHAELRRLSDNQVFTIPNLQGETLQGSNAQGTTGPYLIRLRLPTDILTRGNYQILLTGISPSGTPSPSEEYSFALSN
jgi:hypothetical protein